MEKFTVTVTTVIILAVLIFFSCKPAQKAEELKPFVSEVVHPEWSNDAVIYEVNIRQFTPEGTFNAFAGHLPRLKELGVDILWLMPISPIGEKNRKEPLGSYYSVKDYMAVNPEFGTMDDFKSVLKKAHEMGFHVIIDWVPNHSAWDNKLTELHPEFYVKDSTGSFIPPIGTDWTDVIQFDWTNQGLQDYMVEALRFWVEIGVDGFRVDHPHKTPYAFWDRVRPELEKIKPVFMLAENEWQTDFMKKGFDMSYAWELHHLMNSIAQGKDSLSALRKYYRKELTVFPQNVYRMVFLDNHDENSWNGTINSRMGEAQDAFAVFSFTTKGTPLLYNGQEACLAKSLRFFSRDTIIWDTCSKTGFYKDLIKLKKQNQALWNGEFGGRMDTLATGADRKVFAYMREKEGNRVIVMLNLSKKSVSFKPEFKGLEGSYSEYFTGNDVSLPLTKELTLNPWGYSVLVSKN
jgi:glycosidase